MYIYFYLKKKIYEFGTKQRKRNKITIAFDIYKKNQKYNFLFHGFFFEIEFRRFFDENFIRVCLVEGP